MKKIVFNKNDFFLNGQGALYWPKNSSLIVSDLHLEKSSYFAKFGQFLPPYDSLETLEILENILKKQNVKTIILLGDIFHDSNGYKRLDKNAKSIFDKIKKKYKLLYIIGNHDQKLQIPGIKTYLNYLLDGINFSHKPNNLNLYQIFGHFHPKISIKFNGNRMFKKCFIVSKNKICMPAFGVFTGGIDANNKIFDLIFTKKKQYYIIENSKIYSIKS